MIFFLLCIALTLLLVVDESGLYLFKTLRGDTIFAACDAWIVKPADIEFGKEVMTRAWAIHTGAPAVYVVGGNALAVKDLTWR